MTSDPVSAGSGPPVRWIVERLSRLGALAFLIALPLLSLLPSGTIERTSAGKEAEHFIAYTGTALLLILGTGPRPARLLATVLLICFAATLEIAQSFTATRSAEWAQFIASATGSIAGLVVGSLAGRLLVK